MDLQKKCQEVTLCKKSLSFLKKKYFFSDRNARKYLKSKIDFKNVLKLKNILIFIAQKIIFLIFIS